MLSLPQAGRYILRSTSQTKVCDGDVFIFVFLRLGFSVADPLTGGAPVTSFVYRACAIQGTQQIYVVALWYWGAALAEARGTITIVANLSAYPKIIVPVCIVIALLMWIIGVVLFVGLPKYYRQSPGHIPAFYPSLFRRKIIVVCSSYSIH